MLRAEVRSWRYEYVADLQRLYAEAKEKHDGFKTYPALLLHRRTLIELCLIEKELSLDSRYALSK